MKGTRDYPRPSVTVDCVVFGHVEGALKVLLIRRGIQPYKDHWALPGGFVRLDESLEAAARRELAEETGVRDVFLEQLYTFGEPARDPRERVISVAYYALVDLDSHPTIADTDAAESRWFSLEAVPNLAFDHGRILETARERLRAKVRYQPIGFELLPRKFTLSQLQTLYETVLGEKLDKRNFRKRVADLGLLKPLKEFTQGVGRPARFHEFDQERYERLEKRGFHFEL